MHPRRNHWRASLLWAEFALLFIGLPLLFVFRWVPAVPIPVLIVVSAVMTLYLFRDDSFQRVRLWNLDGARHLVWAVLQRAAALAGLLGLAVFVFAPEQLFDLLRQAPKSWAAVMFLYPILSVYPQELVYRAFFFHRYQPLFRTESAMILASTAAFAFVHVIFGNLISVVLTVAGGWLFATTYQRSRSLLLVSVEHAILGNCIFTVGLGRYFASGSSLF